MSDNNLKELFVENIEKTQVTLLVSVNPQC